MRAGVLRTTGLVVDLCLCPFTASSRRLCPSLRLCIGLSGLLPWQGKLRFLEHMQRQVACGFGWSRHVPPLRCLVCRQAAAQHAPSWSCCMEPSTAET